MLVHVTFSSSLDIATPVKFVSGRCKVAHLNNYCISKRALHTLSTPENLGLIMNFMHLEI